MDAVPQSGKLHRPAAARTDVLALIDEMERSVSTLRAVQDALDEERSSAATLADERDDLLEQSLAAQARIAHLGCEREEFRRAMEQAQSEVKSLKASAIDAASVNAQWEAECASRSALCSAAEQSLEALRAEFAQKQSEASQARAECDSLRASLDSLAIAGGASDEASASLQSLLDQRENSLSEVRASLAAAEALATELETRVATAKRETESRARESETAQANLRLATDRLGVLAKHTVEQARKIAELQGQLAASNCSDAATDDSAWAAERTALEARIAAANDELRMQREVQAQWEANAASSGQPSEAVAPAAQELAALRRDLERRAAFLDHRRETLRKYRAAVGARRAEWGARETEIARAVERKINEVREEARADAKRDAEQRVREAVAELQRGSGVPSVTMEEFQRRVREEEERQERERLELSENRRLLSESEHELSRRYSTTRGGTVLALSCVGIALCAWCAWWLSGELAPKTAIASLDLAVTSRSGDVNAREEADPAPILAFMQQAPKDPTFHSTVAARLQDRGFTNAEAIAEMKVLPERLKIDSSNGAFVHLTYVGDARSRMVLDTATTTLVQEVNKAPERKQDCLRVSIAGLRQDSGRVVFSEGRAMPDPDRTFRAAGIFGAGFAIALCLGFGGWAFARRAPKMMEALDD